VVPAIGALIILPLLLPQHLRLGPSWLVTAMGGLLLAALLATSWARLDREATLVRVLAIGLTLVLIAAAAWMTALVISDLVRGGPSVSSASVLLSTGGLVWVNNVILFGVLYWQLDGGGPVNRERGARPRRDLAFPQHMSPELGALDWQPAFVDYLYVGFTNGLAFSPTDAMPLTATAKLTMAAQALVSFVLVGLVIARAVNILA
jgi:uncharacterized membrane protein